MKTWTSLFFLVSALAFAGGKDWKHDLGLSYVQTGGNTETQTFSWKFGSEGRIDTVRILTNISYLMARDHENEIANKFNSGIRGERNFAGGLFVFLEATYKRDKFSGYTYRASLGPGLGYEILKTDKRNLKGMASALYYYDQNSVSEADLDKYGSGKIAIDYLCNLSESATWKLKADYQTSLEQKERWFINGEAILNVALNSRLAIGLSYLINHQNLKPAPEIKKTDTSFLTSLLIHL